MLWSVEGADYVVWRRLLEAAGETSFRVRLDAVHAAVRSRCRHVVLLGDGQFSSIALVMVAEAAAAANRGKTEAEWQEEWIRALVAIAGRRKDEAMSRWVADVVAVMPRVIAEMKHARAWPWPIGRKRAEGSRGRNGSSGRLAREAMPK